MFQGLSLNQAPPYKIPLMFYITAAVYLVVLSILFGVYVMELSTRYDYLSIALTHTLTVGFFTHVMFGSMFQMIPVMLGIAYKNVERNANIIYTLLNVGLVAFVTGFVTELTPLLHIGGSSLLVAFLFFSYLSFSSVFESAEKDFLVQNFAASFALLFVASIFGFVALIGHSGFVSSVKFGDIHIALMLFGWVFLLVNAVSYKIIPMFFVAKEFPTFIKRWLYVLILALLFAFVYFRLGDEFSWLGYVSFGLAFCVVVFAVLSIVLLRGRKRARKDVSVDLWYFAMGNAIIAALLFCINSFMQYDLAFFIAFFALFGGLYPLINAMLYKIVPFLTWFHLSSSMVFEAEMNEVIKKDAMQLQVRAYYVAYLLFIGSFFWKFTAVAASLAFLFSSVLLLKNIIGGYRYYNEYIKKKIDMGDMSMNIS